MQHMFKKKKKKRQTTNKHGCQVAHLTKKNPKPSTALLYKFLNLEKTLPAKSFNFRDQFYTWVNSLEAKRESTELEWSNGSLLKKNNNNKNLRHAESGDKVRRLERPKEELIK